ncbi:MAG: SURF1 family protein [Burkholderiaceae bacterium]|nr:SURF1 family protein [Burkholderiaceae bacterium]
MRLPFRFRWIPFAATAVVVVVGIALGNWQQRRAADKEALSLQQAAFAEMPLVDASAVARGAQPEVLRRVVAEGRFVAGWPLYVDNRPHQGKAGFYLLMPLKLAGSDAAVLVLRGWFARDPADRTRVPDIPVPPGPVRIEGRVRDVVARTMPMGTPPPLQPRTIVQNVAIDELAAASGLTLQNFIIEQTSDTPDGLLRDWPAPSAGIDKHRGYAFQWYALAAAAFIFFLVTGFRSGSKRNS